MSLGQGTATWLSEVFHLSTTFVASSSVVSALETQCVFVMFIAVGVGVLRLGNDQR